MRFSLRPFILFGVIFIVEVWIALFLDDQIIRPLVGDVLVVVLLFYLVKAFWAWPDRVIAWGVFLFACVIELSQYFDMVTMLGLGESAVARTVLGTTFDWWALVAHGIGAVLAV